MPGAQRPAPPAVPAVRPGAAPPAAVPKVSFPAEQPKPAQGGGRMGQPVPVAPSLGGVAPPKRADR